MFLQLGKNTGETSGANRQVLAKSLATFRPVPPSPATKKKNQNDEREQEGCDQGFVCVGGSLVGTGVCQHGTPRPEGLCFSAQSFFQRAALYICGSCALAVKRSQVRRVLLFVSARALF